MNQVALLIEFPIKLTPDNFLQDRRGHLASFGSLYELAFLKLLNEANISRKELRQEKITLQPVSQEATYVTHVPIGEKLTIRVKLFDLTSSYFPTKIEILEEQGKLLHFANVEWFFVKSDLKPAILFTENLKALLLNSTASNNG